MQGKRSGAVRHGASQRRTVVVAALPAANPYAEELRKTAGQPLLCCLKRVRCTRRGAAPPSAKQHPGWAVHFTERGFLMRPILHTALVLGVHHCNPWC